MQALRVAAILALMVPALAGCGGSEEPSLMNIRSTTNTPDEFAILPNKPIEIPEDLAALPAPAPGAANRVDPTPEADAVAALGGNPARLAQTAVPASDGALVARATRYGVAGSIRSELAAEDLEYRRRNDGRLLERVFNVNVYYRAYRKQSLDQYAELERWRRRGVQTVAAPPAEQ